MVVGGNVEEKGAFHSLIYIYAYCKTTVILTISVLQACCAMTTEYGIPSDFVRKLTASLQIKISTAHTNFSNTNVIIF